MLMPVQRPWGRTVPCVPRSSEEACVEQSEEGEREGGGGGQGGMG